MSVILAIDAADRTAGVAVSVEGEVRSQAVEASPLRPSERLFALIDAALAGAGVGREELTGVAVTRGPGSFTGLRVGIATAKGIAFALGLPVVGVSTLEALARGAMPFPGVVAPVLDARKRQVYAGAFDGRSGACVLEEGARDPAHFAQELSRLGLPSLVLGSGLGPYAGVFEEALGASFLPAPPHRWGIPPAEVACLGEASLAAGAACDPARLQPVYHRLSEAEEVRRSRRRSA